MFELFALLYESPYIFAAVIIALVIVMYIMIRLVLFISKKRHPGKYISHILWKMRAKREKGEMQTVEEVYASIMESLRKEGVLGKKDNDGLRSRKKVLASLPDGEKKKILLTLFELFEAKEYGNRRISNEPKVVSGILDRYANL
jgi:hypothetical protein